MSDERPSLQVRSLAEDEVEDAVAFVLEELDEHAVVLVKGSRALRLERVVGALRREIDTAASQQSAGPVCGTWSHIRK